MRYLDAREGELALFFFREAIKVAEQSPCLRSKCGSVVVSGGEIIGRGFNSPPGNVVLEKCLKDALPDDFKSDKTCCVHAEQRAIMEAFSLNSGKIKGSSIYFIRLDLENKVITAGKPYCTICSKMALDSGIKEFLLWHEKGIRVYDTFEYNEISFGRKSWKE